MAQAKEIAKYSEELLNSKDFTDYCHNGLQVEGRRDVKKVVTGVTLSEALLEQAINEKADMLLVHHGLFGLAVGTPPIIKNTLKIRLKLLLENDINLLGFHLPLDAHEEIGNNASIARKLGVSNLEKCDVGFIGDLEKEMQFEDFLNIVNEKLDTESDFIEANPNKVKKVAIISGGSSPSYELAFEMGADTFVCGDMRENIVREAEELGINIINAGHYNTEKLGVQNLGEKLKEKFGVEVKFIDIPNEV